MILVDIGNSGIRAVQVDASGLLSLQCVFRLSWTAILSVRGKQIPQQQASENQRWCGVNDRRSYEWLVAQFDKQANDTWWISSVHQGAMGLLESVVRDGIPNVVLNKVLHHQIPMEKEVDHPERTGIDRLLTAWESWHLLNEYARENPRDQQAVIVAQAGTALTVDCVTRSGIYRGGAIAPGLGLSLQLLAAGTDQLPWLGNHQVTSEPSLPGKDTSEAIAAGVHASLAGGVRFLIERYRRMSEWSSATVVITGGDSEILQAYAPSPSVHVEHLVLRGLYRLAKFTTQGKEHANYVQR